VKIDGSVAVVTACGHFVAVASAAGLLTQLGGAPYSVTKHAAVGFAEWFAIKYGDKGIGVSCVCPMGVAPQCCAACPTRRTRRCG